MNMLLPWYVNAAKNASIDMYSYDAAFPQNAKQYGSLTSKSGWCFKKIRIHHDGKQVEATIKGKIKTKKKRPGLVINIRCVFRRLP